MPRTNKCAYCNNPMKIKGFWPYCSCRCQDLGDVYRALICISEKYGEKPPSLTWPDGKELDYTP